MNSPILYHKAKAGDLRQWRVWAKGDTVFTEYGQVGGKLQISEKKCAAKNVGRSNESTPNEQAIFEATSLHKYKLDRKYSRTPEEASEELRLPMLAHKIEDKKKHVVYPAHIQPKLDGVRCLAWWENGNILLSSRSGKPYEIPTVKKQLAKWLPREMALDGELYVHGMKCQEITSLVKKWKPESEMLIYNVYDVPVAEDRDNMDWSERFKCLTNDVRESDNVSVVDTVAVFNEREMRSNYGRFLKDGYEGGILRLSNGLYLWGYRSTELLKIKDFLDGEFEVVGAKEGRGKMAGGVIWECRNDLNANTFECTMKCTMEERRDFYCRRSEYIGRSLTVRYFDRTDDQIPRFPVGILFRDEKDL